MIRISRHAALVCAAVFFAGLLCCGLDAVAQDKDKKADDKDKKDKKADDKDKKEEKKKEEFKPDPAQVELKGHKDWIFAVGFGDDGKTVVSTSRDKTAKLWDLGNKKELNTLKGYS